MTKKERKGIPWFVDNFCVKCQMCPGRGEPVCRDVNFCIEAEKLRVLKNGCIDVSTR